MSDIHDHYPPAVSTQDTLGGLSPEFQNQLQLYQKDYLMGRWSQNDMIFFSAMLQTLQNKKNIKSTKAKSSKAKSSSVPELTPWERIQIARHAKRPKGLEVIQAIGCDFEELHGDRNFGDDPALVSGFITINQEKFVFLVQEKGSDVDSRIARNFGMMQPEGYRKALRMLLLAEKFSLPVISIIDTPGAFAGLEAEQRGQAWAIADNLKVMARLRTPILALVLGEGCSGGALGIGLSDTLAMLEHAYYCVISPEGCASILWKSSSTAHRESASRALKLTCEDLHALGLLDEVIDEPLGGAHLDPSTIYVGIQNFITRWLRHLSQLGAQELVARRYQKYRNMGVFIERGALVEPLAGEIIV